MKILVGFILILLSIIPSANARPSVQDSLDADELFTTEANHQAQYLNDNGIYQQQSPKMRKKFVVEVTDYVGPRGKGFIIRVKKIIKGKVYVQERQTGPETDRGIFTTWTCINCNGETDED